jgi:hypothetical protein
MLGANLGSARVRIILSLVLAVLAVTARAQDAVEREWAVMVYMNAKNNLEPYALSNFHSMALVGSTPKVSVVAQLGRPKCDRDAKPPTTCYTTEDGNWSGVHRFLVEKNTKPRPEQARVDVAAIGESTDMGSPQALRQFIRWAKKNYPAKRYMLVIWNHGQGWRFQLAKDRALRIQAVRSPITKEAAESAHASSAPAVGGYRAVSSDDDTGNILYNREVQDVIAGEFAQSKLDLLGYDACLMAMIETAYGLVPSVDVMVGSEELEPGTGWRYSTWLDKLVATPTMGPEQVSRALIDSYRDQYGDEYLTTLSAIRLSAVPQIANGLSGFSDALRMAGEGELAAMRKAREGVQAYGGSVIPPLRTSVDIAALLRAYERNTSNAGLRARSATLRADIAGAVIANYASARSRYPDGEVPYGSEGLAIYYPESADVFYKDYFHKGYLKDNKENPVDFVQRQTWAELLYKLLGI